MQTQEVIPILSKDDLVCAAGYLFGGAAASLAPRRVGAKLFAYRRNRCLAGRKLFIEGIADTMRAVLGRRLPEASFDELARRHYEALLEDQWINWSLTFRAKHDIQLEIIGREHLGSTKNSGVVFWSTAFCGSILPKMATHSAGAPFTMLSALDHGATYPLSRLGEHFVAPLARIAENRFLASRVLIPRDQSLSYIRELKSVLRRKGSICVAGERDSGRQQLPAEICGREMMFPTGAPSLALSHDAPLIPLHVERLGELRYRATIGEPVQADRSRKKKFLEEAIADYGSRIERYLLRDPTGWHWTSSRVRAWVQADR